VGTGEEAPGDLIANPANWRTHPTGQRAALRGSLTEVGWVQQVMVNRRSGHVVDGHARVEEALARGEATVPVLYVDLDPEEEALVLATLDPIGAMATRDDAKLAELLAGISIDNEGLAALLGDLLPRGPKAGLTDADEVPEVKATSIKRGDLFALGDHRLLCGDAVNPGDVARLLGGGHSNVARD
jgi:ParB-like chromosome segregation protein Spo0J